MEVLPLHGHVELADDNWGQVRWGGLQLAVLAEARRHWEVLDGVHQSTARAPACGPTCAAKDAAVVDAGIGRTMAQLGSLAAANAKDVAGVAFVTDGTARAVGPAAAMDGLRAFGQLMGVQCGRGGHALL